jgi:hypothetical protein
MLEPGRLMPQKANRQRKRDLGTGILKVLGALNGPGGYLSASIRKYGDAFWEFISEHLLTQN